MSEFARKTATETPSGQVDMFVGISHEFQIYSLLLNPNYNLAAMALGVTPRIN